MSNRRFSWKIALMRIAGIVLGIAGIVAGYVWFFHWGPLRRILDPAWDRRHSETAHWEEFQACAARTGWTHDGGWTVGKSGDRQWVQRILDQVQSDDDLVGCCAGHKDLALRFLTNQDAGKSLANWRAWWEQNKAKSQEDWIREGFRKYDVDPQTPLTLANTIALLELATQVEEEKGGVPNYVQFNAFRWLRDSDFNPQTFSVKDIPARNADRVLHGLIRFASLSDQYPKYAGLGVLNLGKLYTQHDSRPVMLEPQYQLLANTVVFVPLCTGLLLLWLSFRPRGKEKVGWRKGDKSNY